MTDKLRDKLIGAWELVAFFPWTKSTSWWFLRALPVRGLAMAGCLSAWKARTEFARKQAEAASTPEARQAFLAVAQMWERLIQQVENSPLLLLLSRPKATSDVDDPGASQ
jgi:hypothetical protein